MARQPVEIDRDKLRAAIRKLGDEYVFYMLDDAIDLLSTAKLHSIIKKYLDPKRLRPDSKRRAKATILESVKAFEKASLAGEYYESFNVNSRNCTVKSTGTTAWISECRRHLDGCVEQAKTENSSEVCQAFDILFQLLDRIDECREDIIFFADEAGSWQVGVDWERVLPPWFIVLSATAEPGEYARRVIGLLTHHYDYGSAKMLAVARKVATLGQREALIKIEVAATVSRGRE